MESCIPFIIVIQQGSSKYVDFGRGLSAFLVSPGPLMPSPLKTRVFSPKKGHQPILRREGEALTALLVEGAT
jgi:hypothetical protein